MDQRLRAEERLKSKLRIAELFTEGKSAKVYPFVVRFSPSNGQAYNRIAISIPKKRIKTAVKRNLIKRRTREAYRLQKDKWPQPNLKFDAIFIYIANEPLDYKRIYQSVGRIIEKVATPNNEP